MPQVEVLFDIRVIDTDAKSFGNFAPFDVLTRAEKEKNVKYTLACEERRAVFTLLCISVDGMMGKETDYFLRRLGETLSLKWEKSYSQVMEWLKARKSFAVHTHTHVPPLPWPNKWCRLLAPFSCSCFWLGLPARITYSWGVLSKMALTLS